MGRGLWITAGLAACLIGAASVAQVVPAAQVVTRDDLQRSGLRIVDRAWVDTARVWPSKSIPVCWEDVPSSHRQAQDWVKAAAKATWEASSGVRFGSWPACAPDALGVRVRVTDGGSYTDALGKDLDGTKPCYGVAGAPPCRVYLNLDVSTWPSGTCASSAETCIKALAVHELGHVLALAHEQNSPSAPFECSLRRSGPDGDLELTPFDPASVMNYCRPLFDGPVRLSAGDIKFVQTYYGRPRA